MRFILKIGYRVYIRILNIIKLPFNRELYNAESYFPEYQETRKNMFARFLDQFCHILRYGSPNKFYFLYGLDIRNFNLPKDYIDYTQFMRVRNRLNNFGSPHSSIGLLRNKFFFSLVANALNIPTPENIGIIENGVLFILTEKKNTPLLEWIAGRNADVFIKSIGGECGDGVYHVKLNKGEISIDGKASSPQELLAVLGYGKYLLQNTLVQHPRISAIYPKAVNTIRLETIYDKRNNKIEILPPLLRVGVGNNNVDNWAAGGLAIGIDASTGTLSKYGFYKPGFGTKATSHPTTKVKFEGYEIPYMQEAISLAKRFHTYLSDIHSIGWDIAITENGPLIIEGNDNWEVSLVQICSHGLQKEFEEYFIEKK